MSIWAINVWENKSTYESFISENGYAYLVWGLDSSGDITKMYKVRSIPVTYIIDGEGIIRYAHVGFGGGMEQSLSSEIESLLD